MNLPLSDLHAMIVHFPIALLFTSIALELASLHPKLRPQLRSAALVTLLLGTVAAAVAVWTGPEQNARGVSSLGEVHQLWANITFFYFMALSAGRVLLLLLRRSLNVGLLAVYLVLAVVGLGMLTYTGYLGGKMVYDQAVGVRRDGQPVVPPVRGHFRDHG